MAIKPSEKPGADADEADRRLLKTLGERLRRGRAGLRLTRRELAQASGVSQRYLARLEAGDANPSLLVLSAIAAALGLPIDELVAAPNPPADRAVPLLDDLKITLIGLRGAGKSTLGRLLAERFNVRFIELNKLIEKAYGGTIASLFALSGPDGYRRYERRCLNSVCDQPGRAVIATGGGIVTAADAFALLRRRTFSVWLRATPRDHMERVLRQGDLRPMADRREAMSDLKRILSARETFYGQAAARLDTSGQTPAQSLEALSRLLRRRIAGFGELVDERRF